LEIASLTHVVLDQLADLARKLVPALLVLLADLLILAGQVVLQLESGCHSCHRAVCRVHQDLRQRLEKFGQIAGRRLLKEVLRR